MQLQDGKRYVCRDGSITSPIASGGNNCYLGSITFNTSKDPIHWIWNSEGCSGFSEHPFDIIQQYEEPIKVAKHIDQMSLIDYRRGAEKVHPSFRLYH
jgi:hypothetical protein